MILKLTLHIDVMPALCLTDVGLVTGSQAHPLKTQEVLTNTFEFKIGIHLTCIVCSSYFKPVDSVYRFLPFLTNVCFTGLFDWKNT